jgi:nitroreductase
MTDRDQPGMSVRDAIAGKRVVRQFADRPVAAEHLVAILNAGRRAASSKNLQRWDFIVCRDRQHLRDLTEVGPYASHLAGAAVGIALITPDPTAADSPLSVMFDLGMAAANMMLAAWELGIGSVPATVYEHDVAKRLLEYPDDHHCEYILSFGYPADPAVLSRPNKAGGRQALQDIVHDERW